MRMMLIYVPGSKHGTDSNKVAQNPQNKRTTYIYIWEWLGTAMVICPEGYTSRVA